MTRYDMTLTLKGKSSRGKSLVAHHGRVWTVYAQRDSIVSSKNPGPWCLAVPPAGKDHWHWVSLTNDDDFIVEHVTKSE